MLCGYHAPNKCCFLETWIICTRVQKSQGGKMKQWHCECGCYTIIETTSDITFFRSLAVDEDESLSIFNEEFVVNGYSKYECEECGKELPGNNLQELEEYLEKWTQERKDNERV